MRENLNKILKILPYVGFSLAVYNTKAGINSRAINQELLDIAKRNEDLQKEILENIDNQASLLADTSVTKKYDY